MSEIKAQDDDRVSRYIFDKKHFSSSRVKYNAFIPPKKSPQELSVCITTNMKEEDIWQYAPPRINQETQQPKAVKARADLLASDVTTVDNGQGQKLGVLIDGTPHKYHANIKPFASDTAEHLAVASELAKKAKLIIP